MHSEQTLVELVGLAYDAAGDAAQWTPFLERLGQVLKTPWCVFHVHDLARRQCDVAGVIGFDPAFVRSYEEHYVSTNVFFIHGKHQLVPGNVCTEAALCPDDVLFRSEFYNDWLFPQGMLRGLNATVLSDRSLVSLVGLIRDRGIAPPDEQDVALLQALMPHLQRAVQLHQRLTELAVLEQATKDALDQWALGVIFLNGQGGVVLLNRAAEDITAKDDGLSVGPEGLRTSRSDETAQLRKLVGEALQSRNKPFRDPGGEMLLSRTHSERPLHVLVAPCVPKPGPRSPRGAECIVFVSDPDAAGEIDEQRLRRLYGLTPAESRLAGLLARGQDVKHISSELDVTLNTTRTHLKSVLRKTNTKRQTELAALILSDPASSRLKKK